MARRKKSDRVHADVPEKAQRASAWTAVYEIVRRIPPGRVMTYGQISSLLAARLSPLAVGWALRACPEDVPWQRVVNASGGCSTERLPDLPGGLQQRLLEREGVEFDARGKLDLGEYRFEP